MEKLTIHLFGRQTILLPLLLYLFLCNLTRSQERVKRSRVACEKVGQAVRLLRYFVASLPSKNIGFSIVTTHIDDRT